MPLIPTLVGCGTTTAQANSLQIVASVASAGAYVWKVDFSAVLSGDRTELLAFTRIHSSDAARPMMYRAFLGLHTSAATLDQLFVSQPLLLTTPTTLDLYLRQNSGTGRTYRWEVTAL